MLTDERLFSLRNRKEENLFLTNKTMTKKKEILSKNKSNGIKRCVTRSKTWRAVNLKWKYSEVLFARTWTTEEFVIRWIEGYEDADSYLLIYNTREIFYFKSLEKAKKVAQLMHEG